MKLLQTRHVHDIPLRSHTNPHPIQTVERLILHQRHNLLWPNPVRSILPPAIDWPDHRLQGLAHESRDGAHRLRRLHGY